MTRITNLPRGAKTFFWDGGSHNPYKEIKPDDEIIVYAKEFDGELHLTERKDSDGEIRGIELTAYDDSWKLLTFCIEIVPAIAQLKTPTLESLVEMLTSLGYKDLTEYQRE